MRKAKLAEEDACNLYSFDGRDMPVELEKLHALPIGVEEEHAAEVGELAALAVEPSYASRLPFPWPRANLLVIFFFFLF
jgi:hypothetical protein